MLFTHSLGSGGVWNLSLTSHLMVFLQKSAARWIFFSFPSKLKLEAGAHEYPNKRRCFLTLSIILQFMNVLNFKDVHSHLLVEHVGKGASDYLQVELQALPPLFQDFGNPVSDMF